MDLISGSWALISWRRIRSDGVVSLPLGEDASGLLIYAPDGHMATQMVAAGRAPIDWNDPLGGPLDQRAQAYSGCLAYYGTYRLLGDQIEHSIGASLYPNWSGRVVTRFYMITDDELTLKAPPAQSGDVTIVNEMRWRRATHAH